MSKTSITIKAPAKINLLLQITGKRADGYHLLNSIMQSINLYDTIRIIKKESLNQKIIIRNNYSNELQPFIKKNFDVPDEPEKNICGKVALKLMNKYKLKNDIVIRINKRIPIGAGMGGGSSDGAAVARGLNELFDLKLTKSQLCANVKDIGADIPFNIYGGCAQVSGIGEKIRMLAPILPENCGILIVYPDVQSSTVQVYKNHKLNLTNRKNYFKLIQNCVKSGSNIDELEKLFINDLSESADSLYKKIYEIKNRIARLTNKRVFMSGSGSTLFMLFDNKNILSNYYKIFREKLNKCLIVKTTPLYNL